MTEQWRLFVLVQWFLQREGRVPDAVMRLYLQSLGRR